jgi:ABC-type transport system involved in multi-copper enzyme maturation permease subunit
MTATNAPYRSELPAGHDGFAQLLRAEWTKFRTVRGWTITVIASALLIIGFAYLGTFRHQNGAICPGTRPGPTPSSSCQAPAQPHVPVGPDGEAVSDTYYFVHRTLLGNGSITVRVGSLGARIQTGSGNAVSTSDLVGAAGAVQPWAKAGLIATAATKPGSAYGAVMLTGGHGVRMQYDYTHDIAASRAAVTAARPRWLRLTRSGTTLTGYESPDGIHWTAVGAARLVSLPPSVQAGVFVTSPETAPASQFASGSSGSGGKATGLTAAFDRLRLEGQWAGGPWNGQDVGAGSQTPTLSSVGYHRSAGRFTVTGSGDIAPAVGLPAAFTDQPSLTGVFVGLIVLIVLGAMFITAEYRRGLIHTTLAASPRRGRVLAAKTIVIASVTFLAGAAAAAVAIPLGAHLLRSNGNYVYPTSTLTQLRVIVGTGALLAATAVLALALGTALRRSAGAVTAAIALIILPYILAIASALPTGVSEWLMRLTPAAAFAVEQTLPQYHQVNYLYTPSQGFYPLSPAAGFAVLCAYALLALGLGGYLLRTRDA